MVPMAPASELAPPKLVPFKRTTQVPAANPSGQPKPAPAAGPGPGSTGAANNHMGNTNQDTTAFASSSKKVLLPSPELLLLLHTPPALIRQLLAVQVACAHCIDNLSGQPLNLLQGLWVLVKSDTGSMIIRPISSASSDKPPEVRERRDTAAVWDKLHKSAVLVLQSGETIQVQDASRLPDISLQNITPAQICELLSELAAWCCATGFKGPSPHDALTSLHTVHCAHKAWHQTLDAARSSTPFPGVYPCMLQLACEFMPLHRQPHASHLALRLSSLPVLEEQQLLVLAGPWTRKIANDLKAADTVEPPEQLPGSLPRGESNRKRSRSRSLDGQQERQGRAARSKRGSRSPGTAAKKRPGRSRSPRKGRSSRSRSPRGGSSRSRSPRKGRSRRGRSPRSHRRGRSRSGRRDKRGRSSRSPRRDRRGRQGTRGGSSGCSSSRSPVPAVKDTRHVEGGEAWCRSRSESRRRYRRGRRSRSRSVKSPEARQRSPNKHSSMPVPCAAEPELAESDLMTIRFSPLPSPRDSTRPAPSFRLLHPSKRNQSKQAVLAAPPPDAAAAHVAPRADAPGPRSKEVAAFLDDLEATVLAHHQHQHHDDAGGQAGQLDIPGQSLGLPLSPITGRLLRTPGLTNWVTNLSPISTGAKADRGEVGELPPHLRSVADQQVRNIGSTDKGPGLNEASAAHDASNGNRPAAGGVTEEELVAFEQSVSETDTVHRSMTTLHARLIRELQRVHPAGRAVRDLEQLSSIKSVASQGLQLANVLLLKRSKQLFRYKPATGTVHLAPGWADKVKAHVKLQTQRAQPTQQTQTAQEAAVQPAAPAAAIQTLFGNSSAMLEKQAAAPPPTMRPQAAPGPVQQQVATIGCEQAGGAAPGAMPHAYPEAGAYPAGYGVPPYLTAPTRPAPTLPPPTLPPPTLLPPTLLPPTLPHPTLPPPTLLPPTLLPPTLPPPTLPPPTLLPPNPLPAPTWPVPPYVPPPHVPVGTPLYAAYQYAYHAAFHAAFHAANPQAPAPVLQTPDLASVGQPAMVKPPAPPPGNPPPPGLPTRYIVPPPGNPPAPSSPALPCPNPNPNPPLPHQDNLPPPPPPGAPPVPTPAADPPTLNPAAAGAPAAAAGGYRFEGPYATRPMHLYCDRLIRFLALQPAATAGSAQVNDGCPYSDHAPVARSVFLAINQDLFTYSEATRQYALTELGMQRATELTAAQATGVAAVQQQHSSGTGAGSGNGSGGVCELTRGESQPRDSGGTAHKPVSKGGHIKPVKPRCKTAQPAPSAQASGADQEGATLDKGFAAFASVMHGRSWLQPNGSLWRLAGLHGHAQPVALQQQEGGGAAGAGLVQLHAADESLVVAGPLTEDEYALLGDQLVGVQGPATAASAALPVEPALCAWEPAPFRDGSPPPSDQTLTTEGAKPPPQTAAAPALLTVQAALPAGQLVDTQPLSPPPAPHVPPSAPPPSALPPSLEVTQPPPPGVTPPPPEDSPPPGTEDPPAPAAAAPAAAVAAETTEAADITAAAQPVAGTVEGPCAWWEALEFTNPPAMPVHDPPTT